MSEWSIDTWRGIYDTLKKQRGERGASETQLGQMLGLIDNHAKALEDAAARIERLEAALREIAKYIPDEACPCSACDHSSIARTALEGK